MCDIYIEGTKLTALALIGSVILRLDIERIRLSMFCYLSHYYYRIIHSKHPLPRPPTSFALWEP